MALGYLVLAHHRLQYGPCETAPPAGQSQTSRASDTLSRTVSSIREQDLKRQDQERNYKLAKLMPRTRAESIIAEKAQLVDLSATFNDWEGRYPICRLVWRQCCFTAATATIFMPVLQVSPALRNRFESTQFLRSRAGALNHISRICQYKTSQVSA